MLSQRVDRNRHPTPQRVADLKRVRVMALTAVDCLHCIPICCSLQLALCLALQQLWYIASVSLCDTHGAMPAAASTL